MGLVMGLLFKFRSGTHGLIEELEVEKANQSVCSVVLSVRMKFTYCVSVQFSTLALQAKQGRRQRGDDFPLNIPVGGPHPPGK